jgi:hypothetical protein
VIDVESMRGPDVIELCLIVLFVIAVAISEFFELGHGDH